MRNAHADSNVRIKQLVIVVRDALPTNTMLRAACYLVRSHACLKMPMDIALQADALKYWCRRS